MIDEFCSWLTDECLPGVWDGITTAARMVIAIVVVVATLPLWLLPFLVWYFTEWRENHATD